MSRGMPIDVTRESMVKNALDQGFEWIFFLDSDVIIPDGTFEKLFSHKQPLVNGMYKAKKHGGFFWAAWIRTKVEDKNITATGEAIRTRGIVGRSSHCSRCYSERCMLVHRSVFEKISATYPGLPWFFWSKERSPHC